MTLQNGDVRLKVVEHGGAKGVSIVEGRKIYGNTIARVGDVFPFFGKLELYKRFEKIIDPARPVLTNTHIAFSRIPLGETIEKDGNEQFIVERYDGVEHRFPLPKFPTYHSVTMSDSGRLFVLEKYSVRQDGPKSYTTVPENFDDIKYGWLPKQVPKNSFYQEKNTTDDCPLLFGQIREPLEVSISFSGKVGVRFATTGYGNFMVGSCVPEVSLDNTISGSGSLGVLVYDGYLKTLANIVNDVEKNKGNASVEYTIAVGRLIAAVKRSDNIE